MKKIVALASTCMVLLVAAIHAQPAADVVGTWKMDASRSHFAGSHTTPVDVIIRFERAEGLLRETIKVVSSAGETARTINYSLNGLETENGAGDERIKTRAAFGPDSIVLTWIDEGGTFTRTLKLSNDRRFLSIRTQDTNPDGQNGDLIVLQRQ